MIPKQGIKKLIDLLGPTVPAVEMLFAFTQIVYLRMICKEEFLNGGRTRLRHADVKHESTILRSFHDLVLHSGFHDCDALVLLGTRGSIGYPYFANGKSNVSDSHRLP